MKFEPCAAKAACTVLGGPGAGNCSRLLDSELGTLLGDHVILNDGQLPEVEKARTMIRTLLTDFFAPIDGDPSG